MIEAATRFPTGNAQKYLQQLCKHFGHKIEVEQAGDHATLRFSCGTGLIEADDEGLTITALADDAARLDETKAVVEDHLLRFAFREKPDALQWRLSNGPATGIEP